jgi:hypothetical protein
VRGPGFHQRERREKRQKGEERRRRIRNSQDENYTHFENYIPALPKMTAPLPSAEILVCVLHVVPWPLGALVMSSDYDIGNLIVYDGDFFFFW